MAKRNSSHVQADIAETLGDNTYGSRNPQLEQRIIGVCFRRPSELQTISACLTPDDFSDPRYRVFFEYVDKAYKGGKYPDREVCLATAKRRQDSEIEPEDYEEALRTAIEKEVEIDVEAACHEIHDLCVVRKLMGFAKRLQANISEGRSSSELIGGAEEVLRRISTDAYTGDSLLNIDQVVASSPLGIAEFTDPPLDGIPSPIAGLNEMIQGFRPGQLVIIGARPGQGKSAALCQIGYFAAENHFDAYLFSHEMSTFDNWTRVFCQKMGLLSQDFLHRSLTQQEKDRVKEFIGKSAARNFYISDRGGKTPLALRAELARIRARRGKVDMVLVDYLQLMHVPGRGGNRYQEVSEISRSLKQIAMEFNTRMIVAAQLNRQIDTRQGDIKPQLSDLKESGSIEQDADLVIFPHSPGQYLKKKDGVPPPDDLLIVAKQRRGPTGEVKCKFRREYFRFEGVN